LRDHEIDEWTNDEEPEQVVMTVLWADDFEACMIEFEPGFLQPSTVEERKRRTHILVNAMWTIEHALVAMDGHILRSDMNDVLH
jgi:hypothetical protein